MSVSWTDGIHFFASTGLQSVRFYWSSWLIGIFWWLFCISHRKKVDGIRRKSVHQSEPLNHYSQLTESGIFKTLNIPVSVFLTELIQCFWWMERPFPDSMWLMQNKTDWSVSVKLTEQSYWLTFLLKLLFHQSTVVGGSRFFFLV